MANVVDAPHDLVESRVYFFAGPGNAHAVLRHLQAGGGNAAGIGRLARAEKNSRLEEPIYALDRRRHVRAFRNDINAVPQQVGRILRVDFVLGRARKRALGLMIPKWIVIELRIDRREDRAFELVGIFRNSTAPDVFQLHDKSELLAIDSLLVVNVTRSNPRA